MKDLNPVFRLMVGFAAASLIGAAAFGQTWNEQDDAPELLPGQATMGSALLTLINGSFSSPMDVDLYCITIVDPTNFSATTVGLTSNDTELSLYDSNGNGVTFDDDDPNGGGLQSTLSSQFTSSLQPGTFYIAVTTYNNDSNSTRGTIWQDSPFNVERSPDGPGAPGPLFSWAPSGGSPGSYGIALTGCGFCNGSGYYLLVGGFCPGTVTATWGGATPNAQQAIVFGNDLGSTTIPGGPCAGTELGLSGRVMQVGSLFGTGADGLGEIDARAGSFACGHYVQLVEGGTCNTSNVAQLP